MKSEGMQIISDVVVKLSSGPQKADQRRALLFEHSTCRGAIDGEFF